MAEGKFKATTEIRKSEGTQRAVTPVVTDTEEKIVARDGEVISESDFTKEQLQELIDAGAIVPEDEYRYSGPVTKTADVQALAQDRHRGNDKFPESQQAGLTDAELDERANDLSAKEAEIRSKAANLSDADRAAAVQGVAPGNQAHTLNTAANDSAEKELEKIADTDSAPDQSTSGTEETPTPKTKSRSSSPSGSSGGSQ